MQRFSFEPLDSTSAERSVCWRAVILQTQKGLPSRGTWLSMLLEFCMWNFWGRTGSLPTVRQQQAAAERAAPIPERDAASERTRTDSRFDCRLPTASRAERFKFSMGTVSLFLCVPLLHTTDFLQTLQTLQTWKTWKIFTVFLQSLITTLFLYTRHFTCTHLPPTPYNSFYHVRSSHSLFISKLSIPLQSFHF